MTDNKRRLKDDSNPVYDVWIEIYTMEDDEERELEFTKTKDGHYIGDVKWANLLCDNKGIVPEKADPEHNVCSIGFCEKEQKWYGWSHRVIYGFGIGDVVEKGDSAATSGWTDDYLAEHPEEDKRVPVGFEAKTLDDAKRIAVAFAESVS